MNLKKCLFFLGAFISSGILNSNASTEITPSKTLKKLGTEQVDYQDLTVLQEELKMVKNLLINYKEKLRNKKTEAPSSPFSYFLSLFEYSNYLNTTLALGRAATFTLEYCFFSSKKFFSTPSNPSAFKESLSNTQANIIIELKRTALYGVVALLTTLLMKNYTHKVEKQKHIDKTLEVIDALLTEIEIISATA